MRQTSQCRYRQGREGIKALIQATIRRQDGKGQTLLLCQLIDLFQPVRPIGHATDQPDQDAFGAIQRLLDIGINRKRMFQIGKIGKP